MTISQRQNRECPWCAEPVLVKAIVCKHCGRDIPVVAAGGQEIGDASAAQDPAHALAERSITTIHRLLLGTVAAAVVILFLYIDVSSGATSGRATMFIVYAVIGAYPLFSVHEGEHNTVAYRRAFFGGLVAAASLALLRSWGYLVSVSAVAVGVEIGATLMFAFIAAAAAVAGLCTVRGRPRSRAVQQAVGKAS